MTVIRLARFHRRCGATWTHAIRRSIATVWRDFQISRGVR
jgi:hypothetical protein